MKERAKSSSYEDTNKQLSKDNSDLKEKINEFELKLKEANETIDKLVIKQYKQYNQYNFTLLRML